MAPKWDCIYHVLYMEAKTQWLSFCRQQFMIHVLELISWHFDSKLLKFVHEGQIDNNSTLV